MLYSSLLKENINLDLYEFYNDFAGMQDFYCFDDDKSKIE